jgi:hypothetical protein
VDAQVVRHRSPEHQRRADVRDDAPVAVHRDLCACPLHAAHAVELAKLAQQRRGRVRQAEPDRRPAGVGGGGGPPPPPPPEPYGVGDSSGDSGAPKHPTQRYSVSSQNFFPRRSQLPQKVIQKERPISFKSSQNVCLRA